MKIFMIFMLIGCLGCNRITVDKDDVKMYKLNVPMYGILEPNEIDIMNEQLECLEKQYRNDYLTMQHYGLLKTDSAKKLCDNFEGLINVYKRCVEQGMVNGFDPKREKIYKNNIIKYKKEINKLIDKKVM